MNINRENVREKMIQKFAPIRAQMKANIFDRLVEEGADDAAIEAAVTAACAEIDRRMDVAMTQIEHWFDQGCPDDGVPETIGIVQ
jgi:hypothetical protein